MNDEENDPVATLVRLAGRRTEVDAERAARVRAAVQEEWRSTLRRRRWLRVAAATAVAATVGGIMLLRTPTATVTPAALPAPVVAVVQAVHGTTALVPGTELRAGAEVQVPPDATASLTWNGATLRLDGGTRVRFDGRAIASLQQGAVYYAGNRGGITLRTAFGDVHDVGTRFEVRLLDDAARVRVREGAVSMRGTTARAGTELVTTRAAIAQHPVTTTGEEWAWIEEAAPPIALEGKTLEEVLRYVAEEKGLRLAGWKPAVRPAGSRLHVLHGSVPLTASEALDAATVAAGVHYRIEGDRLIVGTRP
jgi:ferric-dicitrate binding protein FerR (iron transport regulator)